MAADVNRLNPISQADCSYWAFPIRAGTIQAMDLDPARVRLLALVADETTDLATVSRAIGRNHAYLQQFIKRGIPRRLPEDAREALSRHFGVDPDEFRPEGPGHRRNKSPDLVSVAGHEYALLPVYDLRLSAGPGSYHDQGEPLFYEPYRFQWLRSISAASPEHLIVARVDGDSMENTLHNGDQVLIDRSRRRATRDGIYGLRRDDELQVKRIAVDPRNGLLTIISDNPTYPRWPDVNPDSVDIIGRVIWLGRQV